MRNDEQNTVRDWLEVERIGKAEEADRAFASVARVLPRWEPSRRFATGVMARLASVTQPAVEWWAWWAVRGAVAASVVTLGVVLGTWSARSMFFAAIAVAQSLVWGVDRVVSGTAVWIETALTLWGSAAHAAVVVGRLLVAPEPAMLVGASLAIAACGYAALQRLLALQED